MRNATRQMAFGVSLLLTLTGCSSFRLHSEVRDKQGQTAQDALKKVDLSGIFATAADNLKKQLQTELDSQDRLGAAIRAQELEAVVLSENMHDSLVAPLDARLMKLTGGANWEEAQRRVKDSRDTGTHDEAIRLEQEDVGKAFVRHSLAVPTCSELANGKIPAPISRALLDFRKSGNQIKLVSLAGTLDKARKVCARILSSKLQWTAFPGSEFEKSLHQAKEDKEALDKLTTASKSLQDAYKSARDDYDKAASEAKSDAGKLIQVAETAAKLDEAIEKLDKANDALSQQFISSERIDAVQKFVDVVLQGAQDGKVPDSASDAQAAFILIPQQVDAFKSAMAAAKTPLIAPLAIRKNFEQIKLDAATRELALLRSRVEFSEKIVEAQYSEMLMLDRASRQLHEPASGGKPSLDTLYGAGPVIVAFNKASGADATKLYDATATYLDDLVRLEPTVYKLKYQRLATYHQVALIYAETNARQWMNLISASTNQVAESASGGIKAEAITQAIQAAALFWIGNGVN